MAVFSRTVSLIPLRRALYNTLLGVVVRLSCLRGGLRSIDGACEVIDARGLAGAWGVTTAGET